MNVPFPKGFLSPQLETLIKGSIGHYKPYPLMGVKDSVDSLKEHYSKHFSPQKRELLISVIKDQYSRIEFSQEQAQNLRKLAEPNGYTVVTGQQIHPFLGPQFVYNKIYSALLTARELEAVPVFWMATEDHDFEEIKTIPFLGKSYLWETQQTGAVGEFTTEGIVEIIDRILLDFPNDPKLKLLFSEIREFYGPEIKLADATRRLVQYFWGHTGILCLDPNNEHLKRSSINVFQQDIHGEFKRTLNEHIQNLQLHDIPVNVASREVHLFYFPESSAAQRLRIDKHSEGFKTASGDYTWNLQDLLNELMASPERFSPNVLLRPVFQQAILPNLAYVAGPSEYFYWLELGSSFENMGVKAPRLQLRFSSLFISKQNQKRLDSIGLEISEAFNESGDVESKLVNRFNNELKLDLLQSKIQDDFMNLWNELYALKIPELKQLKGSHERILKEIKAVSNKYRNGEYGENELSKALKSWNSLKNELFSLISPQERTQFFIESVLKYQLLEIDDRQFSLNTELAVIKL